MTTRIHSGIESRKATFGLLLSGTAVALLMALGSGTAGADQSASVDNTGTANADTGGNVAVGNASSNDADNDQDADADGGDDGDAVAVNAGGAANYSDGEATIETGDATAVGVYAETSVAQQSDDSGFISL
ncbi:MAG: hypothetical protein M3471_07225, partial [Actinomycetota bacterium]|nr:hypothetical protein [Actinomycetota bacterium]